MPGSSVPCAVEPLPVAFDVGPMQGHRTGIGAAVAALHESLTRRDDVSLHPYLLSFRTRPEPPTRRLPLPAAMAHRIWMRTGRPRVDPWLAGTQVVHGTNYVVPPSRRPRLVSVYDCWFVANPSQAAPAVRRAAEVLRRSIRQGAVVHTSSHATADRVRELLGGREVHVVHLGPLPVEPPPTVPRAAPWLSLLAGAPYVLAIGTAERRKNLPALVRAFGAVQRQLGDARLVIAGAPGDDAEAIDAAVAALPVHPRSHVLRIGPVTASAKSWLLHHAAVLAYPSLDEGFGFPLLEAQAVAVPIVATRAGSIPEVAGDGAELVPVGDEAALADALVRVLNDVSRRAELISTGRANLQRFSWEATTEAMVALYRRLADEHREHR